ncbi:MAG: cysteine synthase family protein [Corallococcus sp.]|nr:cysteine synthase family protein [Corallococcus sp.]MCM1359631.1 cysteine synthase family protein [Corallococcus sp.]MCM1395223.1 cysteine synthase family protein [Corallococcus sp.]
MDKEKFYREAELLGIGNTPLIPYEEDLEADVYVKNEAMNAGGSVKDRAALAMILDAEEKGILTKGCTIVEATSGNMGISLAYVGLRRGYKVLLAMPDNMSRERRELLQGLGAQLVLTEGALGMQGALDYVEQLSHDANAVWLRQFSNPANALAHYLSTGDEIISQIDRVDVFVAGVGTGGTLCGTARRLREIFSDLKVIAVEPAMSAAISRGEKGAHSIQGIGAGFVPDLYDRDIVDEVQLVTDEQALDKFAELNKNSGYCCGVSSAANIVVCERLASLPEYKGKNIVTVFPDGDDRYFSLLNKKL